MCQKLQIGVYIDEIEGDWIALIRYALFHIIEVSFVLIVLGREHIWTPLPGKIHGAATVLRYYGHLYCARGTNLNIMFNLCRSFGGNWTYTNPTANLESSHWSDNQLYSNVTLFFISLWLVLCPSHKFHFPTLCFIIGLDAYRQLKTHFETPGSSQKESLNQLAFGMNKIRAAHLFYQTCGISIFIWKFSFFHLQQFRSWNLTWKCFLCSSCLS